MAQISPYSALNEAIFAFSRSFAKANPREYGLKIYVDPETFADIKTSIDVMAIIPFGMLPDGSLKIMNAIVIPRKMKEPS